MTKVVFPLSGTTDRDPAELHVGLEYLVNTEEGTTDLLFWMETSVETITVKVTPEMMRTMSKALTFLTEAVTDGTSTAP